MENEILTCRGCGSSNVTFNPKMRLLVCNQCGREEFYSRATLNANGKVVLSRKNAVNFFAEGKYEEARHYAMEVLNISMDNVPALFIIAFYDEYVDKMNDSIRLFFSQVDDVAVEYEELQDMKILIKSCARRMSSFEEKIIEFFANNMQAEEDKKELCELFDAICPYFISRRTSSGYLTDSLKDMYKELAGYCGIPKTCFALLKSIDTNPDSPYVNNSFFLKSKSQYFLDNYIVPVGEILESMPDNEFKAKFIGAYKNKLGKFKLDAGV